MTGSAQQTLLQTLSVGEQRLLQLALTVGEAKRRLSLEGQSVGGAFVRFLAIQVSGSGLPDAGVWIRGAKIVGDLDLHGLRLDIPVSIRDCVVLGRTSLVGCRVKTLDLSESVFHDDVFADGLQTEGTIWCARSVFFGVCRLFGVQVGAGIQMYGTRIMTDAQNALNLERARVTDSVQLRDGFQSRGSITLMDAKVLGDVDLSHAHVDCSSFPSVNMDSAIVGGKLFLGDNSVFGEGVTLQRANVNTFVYIGAVIEGASGHSIHALGMRCNGMFHVSADSALSGRIDLTNAAIAGPTVIHCTMHGRPEEPVEISAAFARFGSYVDLDALRVFHGACSFVGCHIEGDLLARSATISNSRATAVTIKKCEIAGDVTLGARNAGARRLVCRGSVHIWNTHIQGWLAFDGVSITEPDFDDANNQLVAVQVVSTIIGNALFVRSDCVFEGMLRIAASKVTGMVELRDSIFVGRGPLAMQVLETEVHGTVTVAKQCRFLGALVIAHSRIVGGARLEDISIIVEPVARDRRAEEIESKGLVLSSLHVTDHVSLSDIRIEGGGIDFSRARIANNLVMTGVSVYGARHAIFAVQATVEGALAFQDCVFDGYVVLAETHVDVLADQAESWPAAWGFDLRGFEYRTIDALGQWQVAQRRPWIIQGGGHASSYRALAAALNAMGHLTEADHALRYAERAQTRAMIPGVTWCYRWLLDILFGYGYIPERLGAILLVSCLLVGTAVFSQAYDHGFLICVASRPDHTVGEGGLMNTATPFRAFVYSLDSLLPVLDLRQDVDWKLSGDAPARFYWYYYWTHVFLGWTGLAVLVAGLARRLRPAGERA